MRPVFIGDEASATAYRLAGLDARVATVAEAAGQWARARSEAPPLILITAECAAALPGDELGVALAQLQPVVAIVPDAGGRVAMPDYLARVRASLGIGEADDDGARRRASGDGNRGQA